VTAARKVDVAIAGGGPAGMVAGLLFARAGLETVVLEKHGDFLRDFRGDTVHPSTLEIFNELGLLDRFLERPHDRMEKIAVRFGGKRMEVADLSTLAVRCPFIAFMPQWEFLDFVADEARKLPAFELLMNAEANGLIEDNGVVRGVRAQTPEGGIEIEARLVIGADGRQSRLRKLAGLKVRDLGAPIDVLWFSLPRKGTAEDSLLNASSGHLVVSIDRGDYWQCAYVIPKDALETARGEGLEALRRNVAAAAPHIGDAVGALKSWDQVKLLSVRVDRLERWSKPGLLCIGDAAHAMSPIGGVGINLAIQDAVAAANLLAARMLAGELTGADLDAVRKRRLWPARVTQFAQVQAQNRVLAPLLGGRLDTGRPPLPLIIVAHVKWLRRLAARMVGLGARPEHVRSPARR
jgi:2-polyprenyl-6-methoxyphenol hydroxylase-like FAD-dependent oxidoreductase